MQQFRFDLKNKHIIMKKYDYLTDSLLKVGIDSEDTDRKTIVKYWTK